jgi:hypothetical protein
MGRLRAIAGLALAGLVLRPEATQALQQPDLSVKALVAAASAYVADYEKTFAFLIADEAYSQTRTNTRNEIENRVLQSELFLTFLPADDEWVAVRDVMEVDGEPVEHRENLRALLAKGDELRGVVRQVIERNARYNIGNLTRNFNEPTLPLLLVADKRVGDVRFERKGVTRDGGATLVTLAFAERGRPTLVRGPAGSMPATGEFVVEAGTGVVRRTMFALDQGGVRVRLTTEYAQHPTLKLWLPSVFNERYETLGSMREVILCQATYTNYRRFDVTARIKGSGGGPGS